MVSPEILRMSCSGFLAWLDKAGYASYDPYDIWGTRYGLWSRKVYYAKGKVGIPLVAPLVTVDLLCPSLRRLFVKKDRFATCDAQLVLAFLNLHEITGDGRHLGALLLEPRNQRLFLFGSEWLLRRRERGESKKEREAKTQKRAGHSYTTVRDARG